MGATTFVVPAVCSFEMLESSSFIVTLISPSTRANGLLLVWLLSLEARTALLQRGGRPTGGLRPPLILVSTRFEVPQLAAAEVDRQSDQKPVAISVFDPDIQP